MIYLKFMLDLNKIKPDVGISPLASFTEIYSYRCFLSYNGKDGTFSSFAFKTCFATQNSMPAGINQCFSCAHLSI